MSSGSGRRRRNKDASVTDADEGIRLAKRVAALAGCSRREAELLIENGAVRVDGEPILLPQSRVHAHQQVEIEAGARPEPVVPVTLLLHKPAGMATDHAHRLLVPANHQEPERAGLRFLPRHVAAQRCMTALETGASGLLVYTQEWRVERKLQEDAGILEHEVMVDVAGPVGPETLARFERTGLRFALKGARPGQIAHLCDQAGLQILSMKRIRIGRVPLAGLLPNQWRYLSPQERF
jgi:23S rRNA pseudouridine2604 synthase